jgi:hypothetical protein
MGFFEQNAYLMVLIATLLIWGGIYYYMFRLDKRIGKIEKEKL